MKRFRIRLRDTILYTDVVDIIEAKDIEEATEKAKRPNHWIKAIKEITDETVPGPSENDPE